MVLYSTILGIYFFMYLGYMITLHQIWEDFLIVAKEELGSRVIETWLKSVHLSEWDERNNSIYIESPNAFICNWIEKNYRPIFQVHLQRLLNVMNLKMVFTAAVHKKSQAIVACQSPSNRDAVCGVTSSATFKPAQITGFGNKKYTGFSRINASNSYADFLNKKYTFESFVVGPSNSLAYAAAQAIVKQPGGLYNPLFIYGASGLGKTHLLHAIGNAIIGHNRNAVVLYQTADRFVSEFIYAIRFNQVHSFQKKYAEVDVLLIDDIQFISNKHTTQEAFFHIFNSLYDDRKQLIFSSDTFPQNMQGIADRLKSRLSSGMVTDIHQPTIEIKCAILKRKAEMNNVVLSDEIIHFLASYNTTNIRELEGILIRVIAFAHLTKQSITLDLVSSVVGGDVCAQSGIKKEIIDFKDIIKIVNKYYSYSLSELRSTNRNKDLVLVRQIVMYVMKVQTDKSLRDIGAYLGGRNHATVKHALSKIEQLCTKNSSLQKQIKNILQDCSL